MRDHASDALGLVINSVAVIEHDAEGINQKESAHAEQDGGKFPLPACDGERQKGGHIHPHKSEEDGFADSDPAQVPERKELQLGGRVQKCEHYGSHDPEPVLNEMEEEPGGADHSNYEEGEMQVAVAGGPADAQRFLWHIRREVPVEIITAQGSKENEQVVIGVIVLQVQ